MSFNLDSLFVEWRSKVSTGVPNPKNDYHLVLLKEICLNRGIDVKIVDNVILTLEQDDKKIDPETIVKYKREDGEYKEWHSNGKKAVRATYSLGKPSGRYKEWYEFGKKMLQIDYIDGKENGKG